MTEAEARSSVEEVGPLKKRVDVEVPAAVVQASLERAFHDLQGRVRLRGFRPGKAPRAVLEKLYGQRVRSEVIEHLVHDAYAEALGRHNLQVVAAPEIIVSPLGEPQVLRFSATVEICPEVVVSDYEGIEVSRPVIRVADDEVEKTLAQLAESAAELIPVTDRDEVEAGDIVTMAVIAKIGGRRIPELSRDRAFVSAGDGAFPGSLEARLVGLRKGTATDIDVAYPAEANPAVAGKEVRFHVTVQDLGRRQVPALDDEFARRQGQASLEELRAAVRQGLEREGERRAESAVREGLLDTLIARHPFDAPEVMVERRCDALLESLRVPPGAERQEMLATLRKEIRPRAERDVKTAILLDALAAQQSLGVSDEEVAVRIDRIADGANEPRERVRGLYGAPERRQALRAQMLREKALSVVVDRSNIRTVEGP
jgi:trigger factor